MPLCISMLIRTSESQEMLKLLMVFRNRKIRVNTSFKWEMKPELNINASFASMITKTFHVSGNAEYWNLLLGLIVIPAVFQVIVLAVCPESPRFELINKNNRESAISGEQPLINNTLLNSCMLLWVSGQNLPI